MKEHSITLLLTDEEEKQLQELTSLYRTYELKKDGEAKSEQGGVLSFWLRLGLANHLKRNFDYLSESIGLQLDQKSA